MWWTAQTQVRAVMHFVCTQAIQAARVRADRIGISKEEFHAILEEEELKDSLILVYANKQVSLPI